MKNSILENTTLKQLYTTKDCGAYQCDTTNKFHLNLFGEMPLMNICALVSFRKKLSQVDIEGILMDTEVAPLEIFNFACINRVFVFTIDEIIQLIELIEGTFAMLQLNSMIQRSVRQQVLV